MIPRATYRLQFHADFTFADAQAVVPYLARLGISHVYASPITTAARGSRHGYDVIDPTRINPELGGEKGFHALVATLKAHGMGCIIDIVPNHMGVAGDENIWWMDVLEKGRASPYARVFDIDWPGPVMVPVLGAPIAQVLAAGDARLVPRGKGLGVQLYDGAIYPVRPDHPVLAEPRDAALARHVDPEALGALLAEQHYRLIYWRAANDSLNWRRFFSVNGLAGVRVEDPAVFALTHRLLFDLYRDGLIDGVRVDHVDGLADPASYCHALRVGLEGAAPGRRPYIVVEKILARGEVLPSGWAMDGTSGYDFMREVSELLHDPAGQAPLSALWEEIGRRPADFHAEARTARRDILAWQFEGQLQRCIDSFHALAERTGAEWMTRGMIRRSLTCLLDLFPVYRTYGTGVAAPAGDAPVRETVRAAALRIAPPGEQPVLDRILGWLAGEGRDEPEGAADAVRRFQQLSAPIAAKGVEDTAFYRHGVLLSANDVGFDPACMGAPIADFHEAMQRRTRSCPYAMLATATHDHKRGEDARARLAVLSCIPDIWRETVSRWIALAAPHAAGVDTGDLYMLFQALVGAWDVERPGLLPERIQAWQRKALREARLRSSWEAPEEAYEARCTDLAAALLSSPFHEDFSTFMDALAPAALANSLAQTALHYLAPGVPDLYQGCDLADTSMVDPDNRRPVDFPRREALLASATPNPKLRLIADLLARRQATAVLGEGDYESLAVSGPRADHVVAFVRRRGEDFLYCAVAIRLGRCLFGGTRSWPDPDWWADTSVEAAGHRYSTRALFREGVVAVWGEDDGAPNMPCDIAN